MAAYTFMGVGEMRRSAANYQLASDLDTLPLGAVRTQHVLINATSTLASAVRVEDQHTIVNVTSWSHYIEAMPRAGPEHLQARLQ